jgi:hypothetical protein
MLLAVAAAALVVLAVVAGGPAEQDVPVVANCDTPGIAVASSRVDAGAPLRFRLTGPDHVRYVVTLDGAPVRADADVATTWTQTPAGPALELRKCVSPTLTVAPPAAGRHEVAMLAVAGDGSAREVTAVTVTVGG